MAITRNGTQAPNLRGPENFVGHAWRRADRGRHLARRNFPPDRRSSGDMPTWNGCQIIARDVSDDKKIAMYSDTKARVCNLTI